jgi:23S rRNA (pseudouridine1915-N3)-methyltransferase
MRLIVAAVGRLKDGAERDLLEKYQHRFAALGRRLGFAPVDWHEVPESRAGSTPQRRTEEGARLVKFAGDAGFIIVLDERGKTLSSESFASALRDARDRGGGAAAILIGGPDGLSPEVLEAAHFKVALSGMTLPHGLARIVLAEQLYRAATILAGHPYHRG